jgi:hypothetical protein
MSHVDGRSPAERRLAAQVGAHARWSRTVDRSATQPARDALMARFERDVDPDGTLPPDIRVRNARSARKAYFAALALKSVRARRERRE